MKLDGELHSLNIEHILRKFIIDRIAKLWDRKKLRNLLIYTLFLAIGFLYLFLKFAPKDYITIIPFFVGIILGISYGLYMNFHFSNKIKNNLYPMEKILSLKKIVFGVLIILGLKIMEALLNEFYLFNYLYLPIGIAFPISVSISLGWLVKYEKKNGTVYILMKTKED